MTILVQGRTGWLAALLHLAPMPYNVHLFAALWYRAKRTVPAAVIAPAWLVAMRPV